MTGVQELQSGAGVRRCLLLEYHGVRRELHPALCAAVDAGHQHIFCDGVHVLGGHLVLLVGLETGRNRVLSHHHDTVRVPVHTHELVRAYHGCHGRLPRSHA
eukprot:27738-Eustigmatos_ZCMA.PRE.1